MYTDENIKEKQENLKTPRDALANSKTILERNFLTLINFLNISNSANTNFKINGTNNRNPNALNHIFCDSNVLFISISKFLYTTCLKYEIWQG